MKKIITYIRKERIVTDKFSRRRQLCETRRSQRIHDPRKRTFATETLLCKTPAVYRKNPEDFRQLSATRLCRDSNTKRKRNWQYSINPEVTCRDKPLLHADKAQDLELQKLRRRVRELEAENDFLKAVSAYFANNAQ